MKVTEAPTYFWISKVYQGCKLFAFVLESLDFIKHTEILNFLQESKLHVSCLSTKYSIRAKYLNKC